MKRDIKDKLTEKGMSKFQSLSPCRIKKQLNEL